MADTRCPTCRTAGIECPRGYIGGEVRCDVCRHRYVLTAPRCADWKCPVCGGSVEEMEEDDQ